MERIRVLVLLFLVAFFIVGCTLKKRPTEKVGHIYCIKNIDIPKSEATALDIFNRYISDAVLMAGNRIECSERTRRFLSVKIKKISFDELGYSSAQRATIYKIFINLSIDVENINGDNILSKNIRETIQYVGTGLRADFERRYALEELAKLIEIRIYSLLKE